MVPSCFFFSKENFIADVYIPNVDGQTKKVTYTQFETERDSPLGFYNKDTENKAKLALTASTGTLIYLVPVGTSSGNTKYSFTTKKSFKKDYKVDMTTNPPKYTVIQYFNTVNASIDIKNSGKAKINVLRDGEVVKTYDAREHDDIVLNGLITVIPDPKVEEWSEIDIIIKASSVPDFIDDVDMDLNGGFHFIEHKPVHVLNNLRDFIFGASCCLIIVLFYVGLYFCCCRKEKNVNNNSSWQEISSRSISPKQLC
jgi:hypothetical protein